MMVPETDETEDKMDIKDKENNKDNKNANFILDPDIKLIMNSSFQTSDSSFQITEQDLLCNSIGQFEQFEQFEEYGRHDSSFEEVDMDSLDKGTIEAAAEEADSSFDEFNDLEKNKMIELEVNSWFTCTQEQTQSVADLNFDLSINEDSGCYMNNEELRCTSPTLPAKLTSLALINCNYANLSTSTHDTSEGIDDSFNANTEKQNIQNKKLGLNLQIVETPQEEACLPGLPDLEYSHSDNDEMIRKNNLKTKKQSIKENFKSNSTEKDFVERAFDRQNKPETIPKSRKREFNVGKEILEVPKKKSHISPEEFVTDSQERDAFASEYELSEESSESSEEYSSSESENEMSRQSKSKMKKKIKNKSKKESTKNLRKQNCLKKNSNNKAIAATADQRKHSAEEVTQPDQQDDELASCNEKYHQPGRSAITLLEQIIPTSAEGGENNKKENWCLYCDTFQLRLDRHLLNNHADQTDVLKIIGMPKRSLERRRQFEKIRLLGNEKFNKDKILNPSGKILCVRRLQVRSHIVASATENQMQDNETGLSKENENSSAMSARQLVKQVKVPSETEPLMVECPICRGYFTCNNLRNHMRLRHDQFRQANTRDVLTASRAVMDLVHVRATTLVREKILSKLRDDEVNAAARYDLLIILFANKFAEYYYEPDQYKQVRNHIRLLGKLLLTMKSLDKTLVDLADSFHYDKWSLMVQAMLIICEYDEKERRFKVVYNAETLPLLIRKCIKILKNEYTKQNDDKKMGTLLSFEKVFDDEVSYQISRKAVYSRKEMNRYKPIEQIPTTEDIETFMEFLDTECNRNLKAFKKKKATYENWYELNAVTALMIQVFNRRRQEVGLTKIKDFLNTKKANAENEFFRKLSLDEQKQRLKYGRMDIQGKRIDGKGSLYINDKIESCIKLLLNNREKFNVDPKNPYLFGLPNGTDGSYRHVTVYIELTKYKMKCNETFKKINTKILNGTSCRKHLATANNEKINDATTSEKTGRTPSASIPLIVNHLGHSLKVHKSHYKQRLDGEDALVTKILENHCTTHKTAPQIPSQLENSTSTIETSTEIEDKSMDTSENTSNSVESSNSSTSSPSDESINYSRGKISRTRWTDQEKGDFETGFRFWLDRGSTPNVFDIRQVKEQYPSLKNRSEKTIRVRFNNIYKKV